MSDLPDLVAELRERTAVVRRGGSESARQKHLDRAFFLNGRYLPRSSFAQWHGSESLTVDAPTAQLWTAS